MNCDDPTCVEFGEPTTSEHQHTRLLTADPRAPALAPEEPIPATDRGLPAFSSCAAYQAWWNKVFRDGHAANYYLLPWHPMAKKCWSPRSYMVQITAQGEQIDLIALHDDLVEVHRRLQADRGSDPAYSQAIQFFYHLCAATTDLLYLLKQKQQISSDLQKLDESDYLRILGALAKYSSSFDQYIHYVQIREQIIAHFKDRIAHLKQVLNHLKQALDHLK